LSELYEQKQVHTLVLWFAKISGVVANLELGERSGVWGRSSQRRPGQSPWRGVTGRSPPEAESFFRFWISQGKGHFTPDSKIS